MHVFPDSLWNADPWVRSRGTWQPGPLRLSGRQGGGYAPGGDLGDVLVDGGAVDAKQPGDGGDGVVRPGQQVAGVADLLGGHGQGPPQADAAGAGGVQALPGALDDQLADELGQCGEDVEDQPAAGGGGVQGLVQALEPDAVPAQRADDLDQVGQGPGQPSRLGTTRVSPGRR